MDDKGKKTKPNQPPSSRRTPLLQCQAWETDGKATLWSQHDDSDSVGLGVFEDRPLGGCIPFLWTRVPIPPLPPVQMNTWGTRS